MKFDCVHEITSKTGARLGTLGSFGALADDPEEMFRIAAADRDRVRHGPMFDAFPVNIKTTLTWSDEP